MHDKMPTDPINGITPSAKVFNTPFSQQLIFNMEQLNYRIERLSKIQTSVAANRNEYLMVFDAAMVLFRAMFLENGKNNYTFQNYYRLNGREDVADAIDAYLDSNFDKWSGRSIRVVLKKIADKYICHLDSITLEEMGFTNSDMACLSSAFNENNFQNIVRRLNEIIKERRDSDVSSGKGSENTESVDVSWG